MEVVVNAILLGGLYALLALGLSLVFGVLRVVNLAHGELIVGGAYLAYAVVHATHVDPLISLLAVLPVVACAAYVLQRVVLGPVLSRGLETPLVATFGISLILQAMFAGAWTTDAKAIPASYAATGVTIADVRVRTVYVMAFVLAAALAATTQILLTRTRIGVAVRAAAADPGTAASVGINVQHVYAITFAYAAALAAVGGVVIGVAFSLTPSAGTPYLLRGFTVVVLAGLSSPAGTLGAGILIGLVEGIGGQIFGDQYRDLIVYLVFLALLMIRPSGLFSRKGGQ
jgi:branched-chain amino acid transport system permease protein